MTLPWHERSLRSWLDQRACVVVFFSAAEPQEDWNQEPTYGLGLWTYGLLLGPSHIVFTILDIRRSDFFPFYTENSKNNLRSKFRSYGHVKCLFVARETRCLWFVFWSNQNFKRDFWFKISKRKTVIRISSPMSSFKNECLNFSQIEACFEYKQNGFRG